MWATVNLNSLAKYLASYLVNSFCWHFINSSFYYSIAVISMKFFFQQVYVIEGFRPICMHITTDYNIENDLQQYLWPVRILALGRLSSCNNETEQHFQPLNDIPYFITIGILTGIFCTTSCVLHLLEALGFFKLAKVSIVYQM